MILALMIINNFGKARLLKFYGDMVCVRLHTRHAAPHEWRPHRIALNIPRRHSQSSSEWCASSSLRSARDQRMRAR